MLGRRLRLQAPSLIRDDKFKSSELWLKRKRAQSAVNTTVTSFTLSKIGLTHFHNWLQCKLAPWQVSPAGQFEGTL
jgi:hypothetical protein